MVQLDCGDLSSREVGRRLAALAAELEGDPAAEVLILNPRAMHNFAVGLKARRLKLKVDGSLGSYVGGFMTGPEVTVLGNTGWYTGDNMMDGTILVRGNCGSNLGPSMVGGTLWIQGRAGNRVGYGLKGGSVAVEGPAGFETGKMMMGGRIVLLSGVGRLVGESMYGGFIHVRGAIENLGGNCEVCEAPPQEKAGLQALLDKMSTGLAAREFTTIMPRPGKHKYVLFQPRHQWRGAPSMTEAGGPR